MGVAPSPPDPPIYRAFTITPSTSSTPKETITWTTPVVKESNFPQSSLIAELSSLQEKDKSSIGDKITRLSTEQKGAVYNVLVDIIGEEKEKDGEGEVQADGEKLEWSVCEAVRVRDGKTRRTRCLRVFFVRAPVVGKRDEICVDSRKDKGKEKAESRSRSRGKEKAIEAAGEKDGVIERRRSTRERRESKGKGKEIERVEEKKSRRRSKKSRHRKKEAIDDNSDSCS
jgi:hypothetical protein